MVAAGQGKGLLGVIRRASLLPTRYGLSPIRIRAVLQKMQTLLERWELTPTIPVTAIAIKRHPEILEVLQRADVAVHGYHHLDYSRLSRWQQSEELDSAIAVFRKNNLAAHGFRAPYLRTNLDTLELLAKRGFRFDSSRSRFFLSRQDAAFASAWKHVVRRYGVIPEAAHPVYESARPVELPVALPDDEILVDAMGVTRSATLWRTFQSMLGVARNEGSPLVMMVHPERFGFVSEALTLLLQRAADDGAWLASLTDMADWIVRCGGQTTKWPHGRAYSIAVTGDLDAISLTDFAWRSLGR